jgi:subtilisin family serine protease
MTNERVDNCSGPAADISSLDSVLAVGVSNHNDEIGGSGFGDCMDVVAPSKPRHRSTIGVATTDRRGLAGHSADDYFLGFGGTSAAAPLVAGIAGLLLSLNPDLTRDELERILEHTAEKIDPAAAGYDTEGFSRTAGHGRVNAARALVPYVKIRIEPARVVAGEPFDVTVTASAPYGLASVSWSGADTGIETLDTARRREAHGAAFHAATWSGIVIDRPGAFELTANARDTRHGQSIDDYPHEAAGAEGVAAATITVHAPGAPADFNALR